MTPLTFQQKAATIQLLILDVDGVLTDGTFFLTADGQEMKAFHTQDGLGIKRIQQAGVTVAIISGRSSDVVKKRMDELGVSHVFQGCKNKIATFEALLKSLNLSPEQTAYIGDDLPDLPVMQRVGLSIAVANAVDTLKESADWVTLKPGGQGAVREACDAVLKAKQPL